MKVTKTDFGKVGGEEVDLYSLENDKGMVASITNYGGILTSLKVPDRDGKPGEVTCGFNSLEEYFSEAYRANSPYFGCLVGRYAGRIKDGKFTVGGSDYQVETNDGSNHLHGGLNSIDKRIWSARPFEETDRVGVRLSITSPDGDNGYPGTVAIDVTISLSNDNELSLEYSARTDKATPLSLTHHAYFNLNGFQEQVKGHKAMIDADRFAVPDETNVPVGEEFRVEGSVWDYRKPHPVGDAFEEDEKGFEHYYIFSKTDGEFGKVAEISEEGTGRKMEVFTTEPGMLFYTGFYTSDELNRSEELRYGQFKGFCCETSRFPNGPNIEGAPRSILSPGERYESKTVFRFGSVG